MRFHRSTIYSGVINSNLLSIPSVMRFEQNENIAIRYRGFLIIKQGHQNWLVRPERSPLVLLPFRKNHCSLAEVKRVLDKKILKNGMQLDKAA